MQPVQQENCFRDSGSEQNVTGEKNKLKQGVLFHKENAAIRTSIIVIHFKKIGVTSLFARCNPQ
jgi:hypothetical protein